MFIRTLQKLQKKQFKQINLHWKLLRWLTGIEAPYFWQNHSFRISYNGFHSKRKLTFKETSTFLLRNLKAALHLRIKNLGYFVWKKCAYKKYLLCESYEFFAYETSIFSLPGCGISVILHLLTEFTAALACDIWIIGQSCFSLITILTS